MISKLPRVIKKISNIHICKRKIEDKSLYGNRKEETIHLLAKMPMKIKMPPKMRRNLFVFFSLILLFVAEREFDFEINETKRLIIWLKPSPV